MGKISNFLGISKPNWSFLLFIIVLTQGLFFLKFLAFPLFFLLNTSKFSIVTKYIGNYKFYLFILLYSLVCSLVLLFFNFSYQYLIVVFLGLLVWFLCLLGNLIINFQIEKIKNIKLNATIEFYFLINICLSILQLFILMIEYKTINPFTSSLGTSAGDFVKGYFANSSINMIISSFSFLFFYSQKKWILSLFSIFVMLLTAYMSGIVIFFSFFLIHLLFFSKTRLVRKVQILGLVIVAATVFYFVSKSNIEYAAQVGSSVVEEIQPRKITSFEQTFDLSFSSWENFLFGIGMGNFSSRLAFIAAGEYVTWYPKLLQRNPINFYRNHFQLWNYEILSIPFSDGTANQPFSVYNQFIGEYGLFGVGILFFFYFITIFRSSKNYPQVKLLLFLLAGFMLLDYWFEFFSVIIIFELLIGIYSKAASLKISS